MVSWRSGLCLSPQGALRCSRSTAVPSEARALHTLLSVHCGPGTALIGPSQAFLGRQPGPGEGHSLGKHVAVGWEHPTRSAVKGLRSRVWGRGPLKGIRAGQQGQLLRDSLCVVCRVSKSTGCRRDARMSLPDFSFPIHPAYF